MAKRFDEPKVGIHKVYTRTGDDGTTALVGGQRVPKDDKRIDAYGTVDELNAVVGMCREAVPGKGPGAALLQDMGAALLRVQHQLFNLGSCLATLPSDLGAAQPKVSAEDVAWLEGLMDEANARLPALTSFVLPGGSELNARLHLARTIARRAERFAVALHRDAGCRDEDVQFLNRLSDAFFVWSRLAAHAQGDDEVLWQPNQA